MATRRRYKSPPAYRDGGRVPVDNAPAPPVEAPIEAAPELPFATARIENRAQAPASAPPPPADDPLVAAHRNAIRAEALQRAAATAPQRPPTIDEHIDAMPGLTEHKRAFLKANPHFLEPANAKEVAFHYRASLAAGIPDDTESMNEAILAGLNREREHAVEQARAVVEAPAAPRRPSVRVSAPVSREAPAMSGRREPSDWNTLSPEERDIARRSIIDRPDMPKMTDAEKELQYLRMRQRYRSMLADGSYSEQKN